MQAVIQIVAALLRFAVFEQSTVSAFDRKSKITYPILWIQVDEEDCNHMYVDELDLAGNMEIGLC